MIPSEGWEKRWTEPEKVQALDLNRNIQKNCRMGR